MKQNKKDVVREDKRKQHEISLWYLTSKFSVCSISFSSAASGPICRRENASVAGAIWLRLNFWLALEEDRASRIEAPIVLERDGKSLCNVFHTLLAYNRRPARKAVRYITVRL